MYNTPGHVCPETGRRAITLEELAQLPPDTIAYRYIPTMEEWNLDPWRLLFGVGELCRDGTRLVHYASGIQLYTHRPDKEFVYVQ